MTTEQADPGQTVATLAEEIKAIVDMLVDRSRPWLVEHPELSAPVLGQVTHLLELLRSVLADRWHPAEGVHLPSTAASTSEGGAGAADAGDTWPKSEPPTTRPARVQRIPVQKIAPAEES